MVTERNSTTNTMYGLKPIIRHNIPIELPTTMYAMKNIYGDKSNGINQDDVSPITSHIRADIQQQIQNVLKVQVNIIEADLANLSFN